MVSLGARPSYIPSPQRRQLTGDVRERINALFRAYDQLNRNEISIEEFWENKGNLRELLIFFQKNAVNYGLSEEERDSINNLLVYIPILLREAQVRGEGQKSKRIITIRLSQTIEVLKRLAASYPAGTINLAQGPIAQSVLGSNYEKENIRVIVRQLYDLHESITYLKYGLDSQMREQDDEAILRVIGFTYKITAQKVRIEYEEMIRAIQTKFPNIWEQIHEIHSRLSSQIRHLEERLSKMPYILHDLRNDIFYIVRIFRDLLENVVVNIFEQVSAS